MEQDSDIPPTFWLQPPQTTTRRRTPSPIDPVILIILIPIFALITLFFFLPPFLTHTSNILKPASVKSTWDSLNIFLVFFAILCGVLARRNDDVSSTNENSFVTESSSSNNSGDQWVEFSERKVVSGGLRRNSSSYPDLRQDSLWDDVEIHNRFYDDSSPVSRYYNNLSRRIAAETEFSGDNFRRSRPSEPDVVEFSDVKEIEVDTFEVKNSPATPPPPPPLPPPPSVKSKRHSFRSVGRKSESDEFENVKNCTPSPAPPPPPPPPPPPRVHKSRNKHKKLERKVSDATKEIATAISSLYNQKKRKSKRKLRNDSSSSDSSPSSVHFGSPEDLQQMVTRTPPPPPPPPPPTMFQNLFKKGGKHKRIHSVSLVVPPPPPPPPPPPSSIFNNIFKSGNKSKRFQSPSTAPPLPSSIMNNLFKTGTKSKRFNSLPPPPPPPPPPMTPPRYFKSESRNRRSTSNGKPPLPTKTSYYEHEEFLPSGSQSPLIPMPPPPPPPFKMSAMTFELRGDFVRIRSTHSSVCSSPDRDDGDLKTTLMDGVDLVGPGSGSAPGPLFFPSPDVNAKADSFISRLKDEWRMEKINHVKDKLG